MESFIPRTVQLTGGLEVPAPVDRVFELFSPLGEKRWVPAWDPELLHPRGASWETGLIFRTKEDAQEAIWIVTRLNRPAHEVEYHRVEPTRYVARILVRCAAVADEVTAVSTTYEFVGLSDRGNAEIGTMSQEAYAEKMSRWARWIHACLLRE